ncbi:MAG: restriction endonuclease [Deltaproteobacteria bacterium]|nr:restriction endonuclease [Deltaproteobacteria bacterium]
MKFMKMEVLIDKGDFSKSDEWKTIYDQIQQAIAAIEWPPGSSSFTIHKQSGKKRGQGSGVKPIKDACMAKLQRFGWDLETKLDIATVVRPGPIDATCYVKSKAKYFAFEWETGNISSSHRAVNKMSIGLLKEILIGGALILPTRELYQYLTARVGNFRELAPYFPMWKALNIKEGFLAVIAVEHDHASTDAPRIEKGTNGRAMV